MIANLWLLKSTPLLLWLPCLPSSFLISFLLFISAYISSINGFHSLTRALMNQFDTFSSTQHYIYVDTHTHISEFRSLQVSLKLKPLKGKICMYLTSSQSTFYCKQLLLWIFWIPKIKYIKFMSTTLNFHMHYWILPPILITNFFDFFFFEKFNYAKSIT